MSVSTSRSQNYHADALPGMDLFGRKRFAERVADTIMQRNRGSEALVVSITGEWGTGKTTTLDYVKGQLCSKPCRLGVFNPWRYRGEDELLVELFDVLVKAIDPDAKLLTGWQRIGRLLERRNTLVKVGSSVAEATFVLKGIGAVLEHIARAISALLKPSIDKIREQAKDILLREGWRVVILMDEVDRLESRELLLLLRTIKLSADFPNTTYVLAMDEEHVAGAIARHSAGELHEGRRYLEKIIQVRLALPSVPTHILQEYTLSLVTEVFEWHEIQSTNSDLERFRKVFSLLISPLVRSPRMSKTLANAIHFDLGLLPNEVNSCDLALLSCMRILLPELHLALQREVFNVLQTERDPCEPESHKDKVDKKTLFDVLLATAKEFPVSQGDALQFALKHLFPQLANNDYWIDRDSDEWSRDKRVCSLQYFWRYFTGAIGANDIEDLKVERWIRDCVYTDRRVTKEFLEHLNSEHGRAFLEKVRCLLIKQKGKVDDVLKSFAVTASDHPREGEGTVLGSVWNSSASVAASIFEASEEFDELVGGVILAASDLFWAYSFVQRLPRRFLSEGEEQVTLPESLLANRMLNAIDSNPPEEPEALSRYIWYVWYKGDQEELNKAISRNVRGGRDFALNLLAAGCGQRINPKLLDRCWNWNDRSLETLSKLVNLDLLEQVIRESFKAELKKSAKQGARADEELHLFEVGWKFLAEIENRKKTVTRDMD